VILTPQAMTDPTDVAQAVIGLSEKNRKPLLMCWMGETHVEEARDEPYPWRESATPTWPSTPIRPTWWPVGSCPTGRIG